MLEANFSSSSCRFFFSVSRSGPSSGTIVDGGTSTTADSGGFFTAIYLQNEISAFPVAANDLAMASVSAHRINISAALSQFFRTSASLSGVFSVRQRLRIRNPFLLGLSLTSLCSKIVFSNLSNDKRRDTRKMEFCRFNRLRICRDRKRKDSSSAGVSSPSPGRQSSPVPVQSA